MPADEIFDLDARPLFIIGVPRSGTTALQQAINAHPQIAVTDELRVAAWLCRETDRIREGFKAHGNPYPFNHGPEFAAYLSANAGILIRPFYQQFAASLGKKGIRYWGDKYPHYHQVLDRLPAMFPRARYVMIHRDLRDVVVSLMKGDDWDVTRAATHACDIYRSYIQQITTLQQQGVLSTANLRHVAYDAFVADEVGQIRGVLGWLGLEVPADVEREVAALHGIQSHSIRASSTRPMRFDANRAVGAWKSALSSEEILTLDRLLASIRPQLEAGAAMLGM